MAFVALGPFTGMKQVRIVEDEEHLPCLQYVLPHYTPSVVARAYRAAEGGERACNSRTSCIEGEMLAVTKFKSHNDAV